MKPLLFRFICISLFSAGLNFVFAQSHPAFDHLHVDDGLSNNLVRCILRDGRGFMWFGTNDGLNRYDGKEIIIYKSNPADSNAISGNDIRDLQEDEKGILWIATYDGGLNSYDYRSAKFRHYEIKAREITNAAPNKVTCILVAGKEKLWVGTDQNGLHLFNKSTETFQPALNSLYDSSGIGTGRTFAYFDIQRDLQNNFYFGTLTFSLQVFKNDHFIVTHLGKEYPFPANTINCIFIDNKQRIWLGAWDNALHQYLPETNTITTILPDKNEPFSFSGNEILSIGEDKNGWLWLGSRRNGLYIFHPETGVVFNYRKNQNDFQSLSSNTVRAIYKDEEGRMWLGTDAGIDVFDPLLHQFEIIKVNSEVESAEEVVNDFLETSNAFYIATSHGLMIRKNGGENFRKKTFNYRNTSLSITKLFQDHSGTIYLGTNKTAFVFHPLTETISPFNTFFSRTHDLFNFFDIEASQITGITEGNWNNHDVIWFCPYGHGVAVFDQKHRTGFAGTLNNPDSIEHLVRKVFVDSKNNTWFLGSSKGLGHSIRYSAKAKLDSLWNVSSFSFGKILVELPYLRVSFYSHDPDDSFSIRSNNVFDMMENDDGTYWISTYGGGLHLFNPMDRKKMFIPFPSDHNDMNGMMKDRNGNLWIIASGGIEFFDVTEKRFHYFGIKDGIPNEGLHGYFYRDKEGFAYAAGNGFYLRFEPEKIQFNRLPPKISFTHFKIFDQPADEMLLQKEIRLSYKQNFFSFEFAALNFTDPDQNQYSYMLQGVDKDWSLVGNRNFASYTRLAGGHYIFKVRATNNNQVWNEAGISIPVYIRPPLWQYPWFYPLLILLLIGSGFLFYRNSVRRLHHQQEEKLRAEIEAQEHERVRIAQDLHDDFGTRISALKIYMSALEKYLDTGIEEVKTVKESAKNIVNDAMTDLRSLLMNLSPKTLEMHGFYAAVHDLVNRLNHTGMFEVELDVDPALQRFDKKYELALYRITQELLNNSIKHAQCTEISIQLLNRNNVLVLSYADNGKGFDKTQLREKGFGLKNIENRVQLINGKINWDTSVGKGMSVTIELLNG